MLAEKSALKSKSEHLKTKPFLQFDTLNYFMFDIPGSRVEKGRIKCRK